MSSPKCLRKAALCYIEHKEYARASQVIRRCPSGQSSTSYLQFLTAVYQGTVRSEFLESILYPLYIIRNGRRW